MRCWRCNDKEEADEFGLCRRCRDDLHEERPQPSTGSLHAQATPLEQLPPYRPPIPSDYEAPTQTFWPTETPLA